MDDYNILRLSYNGGSGHMTLDLNHFFPCTKITLRKIENLILQDVDPVARVRELCAYCGRRDVEIDDMIEGEEAYALEEDQIRRLRRDQERLKATREDVMQWAEKKRLIW